MPKATRKRTQKKNTTALARRTPQDLAPLIADDLEKSAKLALSARAASTRRAYSADLRSWQDYAQDRNLDAYPIGPAGLAAFIGHLARSELKLSTIRRRCSAISKWHREHGDPSPVDDPKIQEVLRGLAKELRSAPVKKRALTAEMIRTMVERINLKTEQGLRDRAILLVGIVTGMRRSELAAMEWEHLRQEPEGIVVFIPVSKTDQKGEGQTVMIPRIDGATICPIAALREWRAAVPGAKFVFGCSDKTIARVVKRHVEAIGLDADEFSAHSFRSGFMTEAEKSGAKLEDSMRQSRHKSHAVAQGYVQHLQGAKNPATLGVLRRLQRD